MRKPICAVLLPALALVLGVAGCDGMGDEQGGTEPEGDHAHGGPGASGEDVQHARDLWMQIKAYETWPQPEGFEGWQDGQSPHGSTLKYYVNEAAQADPTRDGAVVVKANYSEETDEALMSLTVMEKRAGYDPETGNWFYVKYGPDGQVMEGGDGKKLAGLVGKGGTKGCVPCHAAAKGDDYLFMND